MKVCDSTISQMEVHMVNLLLQGDLLAPFLCYCSRGANTFSVKSCKSWSDNILPSGGNFGGLSPYGAML